MTNEVQVFNGLKVKEVNGQVMFDAETAAIGMGITQEKNGITYVQWKRVNNYLNNVSAHVRNDENSPRVGKGDYITEPQFYKLAIKANNETAERFQDWVTTEVLPSIRKTGGYQAQLNGLLMIESEADMRRERESKNKRNEAIWMNAITKQTRMYLDTAERVSDLELRQALINKAGRQLLSE
jgi:Prophage antirepressor